MDGNQRWSKKHNKSIKEGYEKGLDNLLNLVNYCILKKIPHLSVYALSTENISRPSVNIIFSIIKEEYKKILVKLNKNNEVKISFIGEFDNLPANIVKIFNEINKKTEKNLQLELNVAFNYGTESELLNIITNIISKKYDLKNLSYDSLRKFFYLNNSPDPDILIRTGGHQRLSNFLLLYLRYTELFFTNTLWPDLKIDELENIFEKYYKTKRNYGL